MKEVKILEVHVDKGMKHGQKITFGGEADQAPGVEPGDIVLVLQEKDHEVGQPFETPSFLTGVPVHVVVFIMSAVRGRGQRGSIRPNQMEHLHLILGQPHFVDMSSYNWGSTIVMK